MSDEEEATRKVAVLLTRAIAGCFGLACLLFIAALLALVVGLWSWALR